MRKKLRAQRKFALGAFVPPQNHASTSTSASVTHASHKAVNAPGPVIRNYCSAKDILTRMSLEKAHPHENWQPVVRIEYDCGLTTRPPESTQKKKLKDRKTLKTTNFKKKYLLRQRQKGIPLNFLVNRRKSVSDSGEDTPLSYLITRELAKSSSVIRVESNAFPKLTSIVSKEPATTAAIAVFEESPDVAVVLEETNNDLNSTSVSSVVAPKPTSSIVGGTVVRPQNSPEPDTSTLVDNSITTSETNVGNTELSRTPSTAMVDSTNCMEQNTPFVSADLNIRQRRSTRLVRDSSFIYDNFSITSSKISHPIGSSLIGDPDYLPSVSSEDTIYNPRKRKLIKNKTRINTKRQTVETTRGRVRLNTPTPQVAGGTTPAHAEFTSISSARDFAFSDINSSVFAEDEIEMDSLPNNVPSEQTADWVRAHYQPGGSNTLTAPNNERPTENNNNNIASPVNNTALDNNRSTAILSSEPSTSQKTAKLCDSRSFKMPELPLRFVKRYKNCPTRLLSNLHDLLNYQPTENEPRCNKCKRCELLTKYKKISSMLPVSNDNEPDILEMSPRDVYEFDSDDEGNKLLRRGRELVCNVLTTKRFPIWLSNLEMNLKKTMFQDEHKLGTLKRTLTFDTNDVTDAMVTKVITRVDYLSRCITEDKKELNQEKSKLKLRSSKSVKLRSLKSVSLPLRRRKKVLRRKIQRHTRKVVSNPIDADEDTTLPVVSANIPSQRHTRQVVTNSIDTDDETEVPVVLANITSQRHTRKVVANRIDTDEEITPPVVPANIPSQRHTRKVVANRIDTDETTRPVVLANIPSQRHTRKVVANPIDTDEDTTLPVVSANIPSQRHTRQVVTNPIDTDDETELPVVPANIPSQRHTRKVVANPIDTDEDTTLPIVSANIPSQRHTRQVVTNPIDTDDETELPVVPANIPSQRHTRKVVAIRIDTDEETTLPVVPANIPSQRHTRKVVANRIDTDETTLPVVPANIPSQRHTRKVVANRIDTDETTLPVVPANIPSQRHTRKVVANRIDTDEENMLPVEPDIIDCNVPERSPNPAEASPNEPHLVVVVTPLEELRNRLAFSLSMARGAGGNSMPGPPNRPTASTHQPTKGVKNLPIFMPQEMLVYRPTLEEFKDPMTYISKIESKAARFGICKIIPPKKLDAPCHLDENCTFTTLNQHLGRLYRRWGSCTREFTTIQTYVAMLASARDRDQFTKPPMYDGVELDIVKLYHIVTDCGGIEELMTNSDKWTRVAETMGLGPPRSKSDVKKLEKLYCKHVLPYESLSSYDRLVMLRKVDKVWSERSQSALRRSNRPLHYQRKILGETSSSEDEEEMHSEEHLQAVRDIGKPCFDRAEECTAKGRTMNLGTFRRLASQIQSTRFSNGPEPTTLDIEDEYWSIVSLGNEHVCVLSAFIDTSVDNLGHPSDPEQPGGSHVWNLKRLGENPKNILSCLGKTLSVTVPTLCLNQVFSTNCWHRDPHNLAWMDYMHEGTTKIWYAVSECSAAKFRRAMEVVVPSAVQNKSIWLASDTIMVPPSLITVQNVKMQRLEQNPGEFIVVFPGAYASSVATGFTVSESIYFENQKWLHKIDNTFQQMREDCEPVMFSETLMLLRLACKPDVSPDMLSKVLFAVKSLFYDEMDGRREAIKLKCIVTMDQSRRAERQQAPVSWPNQEECSICRTPLILSKTIRYNDPRSLMCLKHGLRLYSLASKTDNPMPPPVTIIYTQVELHSIIRKLEMRILELNVPRTEAREVLERAAISLVIQPGNIYQSFGLLITVTFKHFKLKLMQMNGFRTRSASSRPVVNSVNQLSTRRTSGE